MKIAVAGTGYVGLSIATLLAQHNHVTAVDIIPEKVDMINRRQSPIQDEYIEKYLAEKDLDLKATLDANEAYKDADFVVIAAPTNYDSQKNYFDTSAVETVIKLVMSINTKAIMVIKSTIPVGFTETIRQKTGSKNIIFAPEFLRESKALYDNLYPSRIIVGFDQQDAHLKQAAETFAKLLQEGPLRTVCWNCSMVCFETKTPQPFILTSHRDSRNVRKKHGMTQEVFAQIFHVKETKETKKLQLDDKCLQNCRMVLLYNAVSEVVVSN